MTSRITTSSSASSFGEALTRGEGRADAKFSSEDDDGEGVVGVEVEADRREAMRSAWRCVYDKRRLGRSERSESPWVISNEAGSDFSLESTKRRGKEGCQLVCA